jgi:hypothetical protein
MLEGLMAEWGFKDMATAEAYWKAQQRRTQGAAKLRAELVCSCFIFRHCVLFRA